ncbi:hypothetical protein CKO51_07525 [Rhodopirellula sp. SM50]|nr:hypothetical protein CKO51_07525 [Rhodopirellula sp. SM50]
MPGQELIRFMPATATSHQPTDAESTAATGSWRRTLGTGMNSAAERFRRRPGLAGWFLPAIAFLLEAISIGLMRRRDVADMVAKTYASRPEFYDPDRYQLPHESRMLPTLLKHRSSCRLLDAFCGQGREAKWFADAGYQVTAIDRLDWMIDRAKRYAVEAGFSADFIAEDFDTFDPPETFEVVYTSCWMYSTVQGVDRRREFLKQCDRLCSEDGLAVVSYVNQRASSKAGAWVRFCIAKSVAWLTAGNVRTEFGERIYTGLFWHHLSDATARREVDVAGWQIAEIIAGNGMDPTFLFLSRRRRETPR